MRHALGPAPIIEHLVVLVVFLLVVALVAVLVYKLISKSSGAWGGPSAAAIRELEMRYARGEIGREDFLQRRSDLMVPALAPPPASPPPPPPPPPSPPAKPPRQAAA